MNNLFLHTADFYDLDVRSVARDDLEFYQTYAKEVAGPNGSARILELACGTGRVAIPLIQAGHSVCGLDLSPRMLEIFTNKLENLPATMQNRVELVFGDMGDFVFPTPFDLVIIPFRGFQALTTKTGIHGCLRSVRASLAPHGLFIVDVFKPMADITTRWRGPERHDWTYDDRETGRRIVRTSKHSRIDTNSQIIYPELVYHVTDADGTRREYRDTLSLRYWYRHQLELELASHGFSIAREIGYYDGRPVEYGPDQIFVCSPVSSMPPMCNTRSHPAKSR